MSNESIDGVIAISGSKRNALAVHKTIYEGMRLLSIRRWYVDAKSKEWRPTKKGVTLSENNFLFLKNVFEDEKLTIEEWFENSKIEPASLQLEDVVNSEHWKTAKLSIKSESWHGPELFKYAVIGSEETLVVNVSHPFGESLIQFKQELSKDNDAASAKLLFKMLIALMASFGRIPLMLEESTTWRAEDLIDTIKWNLGLLLRSYKSSGIDNVI